MKTCVMTFGRFNPVHKGHGKLMNSALELHKKIPDSELKIYTSTTEDSKNVLPYHYKLNMLKDYYPWTSLYVQEDHPSTLFGILEELDESFDNIVIVSGSDRTYQFQNLLDKYNGLLYNFSNIISVCAGIRECDRYSSTNVREAVLKNDFAEFCSLMPFGSFGRNKKYFNELREIMGAK